MDTQFLLGQGGLGLLVAVFWYLYKEEKADHKKTREKNEVLMEARRLDAKDTVDKVIAPLQGISDGIQRLSTKIEATQQGRKR